MSNAVIDCLLNHRSIRKFNSRPVEPKTLKLILEAGTRAATARNLQHYSFVIVDDSDKKSAIDRLCSSGPVKIAESPVVVIGLIDQYRIRRWLQMHCDRDICSHRPANFFLAIADALIALQNIVVAAEGLGLGTCYIGSVVGLDVQSLLGTPPYVFPAGMICMGYPDEDPELSRRLPLKAVVHRNVYRMPTDDDIRTWYRESDDEWQDVPVERKAKLAEQNILGIAQSIATLKYSPESVERSSRGILDNLRRSGFDLTDYA